MTTVDKSVQGAAPPFGEPRRSGVLVTPTGPVSWSAAGVDWAPAVLLLPAADDLAGWPALLESELVALGMQVVTITSGAVTDDALATADAAAAALIAAGVTRAHVVGSSQGGIVAQAMASAHPARVASLSLLMTRRATAAAIEVDPDLVAVLAPSRDGRPLLGRATAALAVLSPASAVEPSAVAARAASAEAAGVDPVTALLAFAAGEDTTVPPLPADVPATVVHGDGDPLVPLEAGRRLATALGADLVVLPAGHDLPWGHEAAVATGVAALAGSAASGRPDRSRFGGRFSLRRRGRARPGKLVTAFSVVVGSLVVGLIAASTIDVPYYSISPGSARPTNDLVEVPKDRRFPPKGQLLFVTVGVGRLKALTWLIASHDGDVEVVPERAILGSTPKDRYHQEVTQEMVDAKQAAVVAALSRLCQPVSERGTGARVEQLVPGSPAALAGVMTGDTVTAVDGQPVMTADQALAVLRTKAPGAPLALSVVAPPERSPTRTATATLTGRPDAPTRSFLGVTLRTRQQDFSLPFDVAIDSGRVGGPSAGLEFALSIVDQLTPGELTGGRKVAVTGTIDFDGNVGPVGGVPQKTVTVRRAGATLFLVPKEQVAEAQSKAGTSVEIVGVATLEEAIGVLAAHGGDKSGIPGTCPGR